MGHQIQAVIGKREAIQVFADWWVQARVVDLPQDCALVYLTDALFDDITELFDELDRELPSPLALFTSAIRWALEGPPALAPWPILRPTTLVELAPRPGCCWSGGRWSWGPSREKELSTVC